MARDVLAVGQLDEAGAGLRERGADKAEEEEDEEGGEGEASHGMEGAGASDGKQRGCISPQALRDFPKAICQFRENSLLNCILLRFFKTFPKQPRN